jgi:hypothetical protein
MNTKINVRNNKGAKLTDLIPDELHNNHQKVVATSVDYFSEWAVEKFSTENPKPKKSGNSAEPPSGNAYQTTGNDQYY